MTVPASTLPRGQQASSVLPASAPVLPASANDVTTGKRPLVQLQGIGLDIRGRRLLHQLKLDLYPGTFTALLGPNGAGKSSLLRIIAGEWLPTHGQILFDRQPLNKWPPQLLARRRAVLPQENALNFPFTVQEVVAMGRLPHSAGHLSPAEQALIDEQLATFDLQALTDRCYTRLSGGEKQRVHLARAATQIAGANAEKPSLLLLDEPTNNLDPVHRFALMEYLKQVAAQGHGVLAVLHDINLALAYADNVALLKEGSIHAAGQPRQVLTSENIRSALGVDSRIATTEDGKRRMIDLLGKATQS